MCVWCIVVGGCWLVVFGLVGFVWWMFLGGCFLVGVSWWMFLGGGFLVNVPCVLLVVCVVGGFCCWWFVFCGVCFVGFLVFLLMSVVFSDVSWCLFR